MPSGPSQGFLSVSSLSTSVLMSEVRILPIAVGLWVARSSADMRLRGEGSYNDRCYQVETRERPRAPGLARLTGALHRVVIDQQETRTRHAHETPTGETDPGARAERARPEPQKTTAPADRRGAPAAVGDGTLAIFFIDGRARSAPHAQSDGSCGSLLACCFLLIL